MLITATTFKPHCSIRHPGHAISALMACRSSGAWVRWGQMCCVCQCGEERDGERDRGGGKQRRREKKRIEKEANGAREGNVVAVCQRLIRALVCPLWVRLRDRHCTYTHMHTHTSLRMSALLSGTRQQKTDKTCTWQTPATKLSFTGLALNSSVRTDKWSAHRFCFDIRTTIVHQMFMLWTDDIQRWEPRLLGHVGLVLLSCQTWDPS